MKIDFDGGTGDGCYPGEARQGRRLDHDGDSYPWFSHQHDPALIPGGNGRMTVFDNGDVRYAADQTAHSRGQVLEIDETNKTAKLVLNVSGLRSVFLLRRLAHRLPGWNCG